MLTHLIAGKPSLVCGTSDNFVAFFDVMPTRAPGGNGTES